MSKFRVGDKVTPINTDHCSDIVKQLMGKTLVVTSTDTDISHREIVWARVPGGYARCLYSDSLQLVSGAQTEPAPQKPLRRGDLVVWNGEIHMVFDDHPDSDGEYRIAALTGECGYDYAPTKELTRIGSIRKKVKRLKNEMESCK